MSEAGLHPSAPAAGAGGGGGGAGAVQQLREAEKLQTMAQQLRDAKKLRDDQELLIQQCELKMAGYQEKAQAAAARGDTAGSFAAVAFVFFRLQ